jgi:hypothetical protein
MSLDWDNLETPAKAFIRKMPEPGTTVIDVYMMSKNERRTDFGIAHIYDAHFDPPVLSGVVCVRDNIILTIFDFNHQNEAKSNLLEIILEKIDTLTIAKDM